MTRWASVLVDLDIVEQMIEAPAFTVTRSLPLCRWPAWPRYEAGPVEQAASFACTE